MPIESLYVEAEELGLQVDEDRLPDKVQALYSERLHRILLDEKLSDRQRRCSLQHELIHAQYHDSRCQGRDGDRDELRTQQETALKLISVNDYRFAEQVYDGDSWHMAVTLGVTKQVLQDYRRILADYTRSHTLRHDWSEDTYVRA